MKINEYAANVSEYTEVVDAPYNHKGNEQELDERPMGFVKGGIQKLGAKLLPGSLGAKMGGKVDTGKQANQLYQEYHTFLGRTGDPANSTSLKAFLQQKGINVDVDSLLGSGAPPAAPTPAPAAPTEPVTESIEQLNRMLILAGRQPKKIINETKNIKKKKILTEEVALNRAALNKVFMQIAQKMAGSSGGSAPAASGGAPGSSPPAAGGGGSPPPSPPSGSPAPAGGGGDFGGEGPAGGGSPPAAGGGGSPPAPPSGSPPAGGGSPPAAGGGGIINRIKNAFKGNAGGGSPPTPPSGSPAPAAGGSGSPPPTPPAAGGGKLGGQNPGADAAKAAGSQKQSTQNMNDYVKNVSAQINAAQTKPEKIELAKELINFMSDRKGSPEYDNAMGSAKAVLKKAGLNNMLAPLAGGQTANQNPQGLRKPAATPASTPTAQPAAAPAETPPAAPAPKVDSTQATLDAAKAARSGWRKDAEESMYEDARVLHRNSYIFIKKVLENTDLTLRDLGYRVSISESTSDSVTLIPR